VLEEAEMNLLAAFKKSQKTKHKGLAGNARAKSIAAGLSGIDERSLRSAHLAPFGFANTIELLRLQNAPLLRAEAAATRSPLKRPQEVEQILFLLVR
jgi:hypothetical protein